MELKERINQTKVFKKEIYPPFPKKNMLIELTNYCNHKCIFCANQKMTRKKGHINEGFIDRLLEEAFNLGVREVGFYTTGEPFMSPNLERYIKIAKYIGMDYVYITTNGGVANPNRIKSAIDAGLDSIKFSINGYDRENYAFIHGRDDFNKVCENLKYCFEYREQTIKEYKIYISHVVTKYTQGKLDEFKKKFETMSDEIFFSPASNQGGLMPEINDYLVSQDKKIKKQECNLLFNALNISYEGYLTACSEDFENALVVADLNKVSLKEAWNCNKMVNLRKRYLENELQGTLCHNCMNNCKDKFVFLSRECSTASEKTENLLTDDLVKSRAEKYNINVTNESSE